MNAQILGYFFGSHYGAGRSRVVALHFFFGLAFTPFARMGFQFCGERSESFRS